MNDQIRNRSSFAQLAKNWQLPFRFALPVLLLIYSSCGQSPESNNKTAISSSYESKSDSTFSIRFGHDDIASGWVADSVIIGKGCTPTVTEKKGLPCLEIRTANEFSNADLDMEKLFGIKIDFTKSGPIHMRILVPDESHIAALKLNFKDDLGNSGGGAEVANNFYGNRDRWMDVVFNMQDIAPKYRSWRGEGNAMKQTTLLGLNPYNAHQADSSSIFIHSIRLGIDIPESGTFPALAEKPRIKDNSSYNITFEDEKLFSEQVAYRSFESTYQAFRKDIGENTTTAIRLKGKEPNKHLAFLINFEKFTGKPVDFTQLKRIYFSYYLTEESDDFDGSKLFLAGKDWDRLVIDHNFYDSFEKGGWRDVSINIADLNLEPTKGDPNLLNSVYELRLGLKYKEGKKNIEMWLDNFGWE